MEKLDKRYKKTKEYLQYRIGEPVYKRRAFPFIDKILGPQFKWINKEPEEYFGNDERTRAAKVCKIFSFTGEESFSIIKARYRKLSKGDSKKGTPGFHPDAGGHGSAFAILNYAYNLFKEAR